ncbi:MAG: hypothetical protein P8X50_04705 [Maritimibacter sp.]|jgi:hypothetical protein
MFDRIVTYFNKRTGEEQVFMLVVGGVMIFALVIVATRIAGLAAGALA